MLVVFFKGCMPFSTQWYRVLLIFAALVTGKVRASAVVAYIRKHIRSMGVESGKLKEPSS